MSEQDKKCLPLGTGKVDENAAEVLSGRPTGGHMVVVSFLGSVGN